MGEAVLLKTKTSTALGDLLRLSRAGKLHGIAYSVVKEDDDGGWSSGTNVIWNDDPKVGQALRECVEKLAKRMDDARPKSAIIRPS